MIEGIRSQFLRYRDEYPIYARKTIEAYERYASAALLAGLFLHSRNSRRADIIFAGNISCFSEVIPLCHPDEFALLTTGVRSHFKARTVGLNSRLVVALFAGLSGAISGDPRAERKVERNIERLSEILHSMKGRLLFIQSDTMPFERSIIEAARRAGIRTICSQHGIFAKATPAHLIEGKFSDVFLAWDEAQARIVRSGCPSANVQVSGSLRSNTTRSAGGDERTIIFWGQPYPLLFANQAEQYLALVRSLPAICEAAGHAFMYKPHPGEIGAGYLDTLPNVSSGDAGDYLSRYRYFMGVASTMLHTTSLSGKIAIQIHHEGVPIDDFAEYGYCYSCTMAELGSFIRNLPGVEPYVSETLASFEAGDLQTRWKRTKQMLYAGAKARDVADVGRIS